MPPAAEPPRRIRRVRLRHSDRDGDCGRDSRSHGRRAVPPHRRSVPRPHYVLGVYSCEDACEDACKTNTKTRVRSCIEPRHEHLYRHPPISGTTFIHCISAALLGGVSEFARHHARVVRSQFCHVFLLEIERASMVFWRPMRAAKYLSTLALGASERRLLLALVEFTGLHRCRRVLHSAPSLGSVFVK